ncbi:Oxa1Ec [Thiorhodovibrio winogradskyi]|uniref:Membrane protein insertase YidC n=1 Tax=Thiorhodovibrio winogradskyi TaxID=77007 RepID=A0ABZ0SH46_9GAMM
METDVLKAEISPQGGTIENLWLLNYSVTAEKPEVKFQLLKAEAPNMFIVQSGLLGQPQSEFPTHETHFTPEAKHYQLETGQDELIVTLRWRGDSGIEVVKTYSFTRGEYLIEVSQEIYNPTDTVLNLRGYQQLQRTELNDPHKTKFVATYTGGVYYGPEIKYKKEDFKEMVKHPLDTKITGGWIAMIQHYFLGAWIPPADMPQTFYTKVIAKDSPEPRYIIGQYSSAIAVAPGDRYIFQDKLFVGPKLPDQLSRVAPGLQLAVDYGWLTILAEPIHWLLSWIYKLVGNWGWSIILLTILIKAAFYKLSETSYKSMAHMRKLTPRMKALKDRYGDDKERLNQAMMELYKKEKINPLGGCLPILIQIPVFIALYWVLLESVELRHAPFIFWLDNLTSPDPYYILPLIMGVSMFVQQKLNPPPPDPMQEKIMLSLPVVFTVFFAFFPSGLVLYWTVNNLLSIAQQWYITRSIEKQEHRKAS